MATSSTDIIVVNDQSVTVVENEEQVIPVLNNGFSADWGRALRTITGQSFREVDKNDLKAKYWVGDAVGDLIPSDGTVTGGDATLRTDLADPAAGAFIVAFKRAETGAVARTVMDKSRERASVRDFGAVGDGVADDTDAVQAMKDALGYIHFTRGTYKLVAKPVSPYTYGNFPATPVYRAVDIDGSNVSITADEGALIKFIGHEDTSAVEVNYAFATAKNMTLGAITNLKIKGLRFDFDPTGDSSSNKRSFSIIGCHGVFIDDVELMSSGPRAGATITLQNCLTVRLSRLRFLNTTQGINCSFVDDIVGSMLQFDNFSEAIDFDRKCNWVNLSKLSFRNGGPTNQCIDINSCTNVHILGVGVYNVGNIAIVNYKTTTPGTYADYVNNVAVTSYSPSKNVTIEGVSGDTAGATGGQTSFTIGGDQLQADESPTPNEDITLRDVKLTNTAGFIWVELARNVLLDDIRITGLNSGVGTIGAIDIRADFTGYAPSVSLRRVHLTLSASALCGIRAAQPGTLNFDDVVVEAVGNASLFVYDFSGLNQNNPVLSFERTAAKLVSGSGGTAFKFGDAVAGGSYQIAWGDGNRIVGSFTNTFALNGDSQKLVQKKIRHTFPKLAITSGATNLPLIATAKEGCYIARATMKSQQAVASDPTNFVSWASRSMNGGVDAININSGNDTGGIAAAAAVDMLSGTGYIAERDLTNTSVFYVRLTAAGAGRTYDGLIMTVHYLDYLKV